MRIEMSFRVSAVQFKRPESGDPYLALAKWADRAAGGTDLVVCPEMACSGYIFESSEAVSKVAEASNGPTFQVLSVVAKEHKTWIVAGYPERAQDRYFNSACVVNPAGELAFTYRKTLLYAMDERWAESGDSGYKEFSTSWGTFGVGICMDLNDDRFVEWMTASSLDVLAFPTNWVQEELDVWSYWAWRLGQMKTMMVAANTYGEEAGVRFSGRSLIMKDRTVLDHAPVTGNRVIWSSPIG